MKTDLEYDQKSVGWMQSEGLTTVQFSHFGKFKRLEHD